MSRTYVAVMAGQSVAAAQGLVEIGAPADAAVRVTGIRLTNESSETSEQFAVELVRGEGAVTSGSGGAALTPVPLSKGDAAFGGTCERNNTTRLAVGTGALKTLHREGGNFVGSGFDWQGEIDISPGDFFELGLVGAPGAAITLSVVVEFEEIGG